MLPISDDPASPRRIGAWLPWPAAEAICRLALRPGSQWRVFLAVLVTSARYGGRDARLCVSDLARMTGLAPRTVVAALAALRDRGLVERVGRTCRLRATLLSTERSPGVRTGHRPSRAGGRGSRRCAPDRPGPEPGAEEPGQSPFTARQEAVMAAVLAEASELLLADAANLVMPDTQARRLGLTPPVTYRAAHEQLKTSGNRRQAAAFIRAALALLSDERVQGRELM